MASRPARTICTAWPPLRAPSAGTKARVLSSSQRRIAPMRASEYSIFTEPRRRSTSACEYGRVTPSKRRLCTSGEEAGCSRGTALMDLLLWHGLYGQQLAVRGYRQEIVEGVSERERAEQRAGLGEPAIRERGELFAHHVVESLGRDETRLHLL